MKLTCLIALFKKSDWLYALGSSDVEAELRRGLKCVDLIQKSEARIIAIESRKGPSLGSPSLEMCLNWEVARPGGCGPVLNV